jgi:hypothetical protein
MPPRASIARALEAAAEAAIAKKVVSYCEG